MVNLKQCDGYVEVVLLMIIEVAEKCKTWVQDKGILPHNKSLLLCKEVII